MALEPKVRKEICDRWGAPGMQTLKTMEHAVRLHGGQERVDRVYDTVGIDPKDRKGVGSLLEKISALHFELGKIEGESDQVRPAFGASTGSSQASAVLSAKPPAPAPAKAATGQPSREQIGKILLTLEPRANSSRWAEWTDDELRAECERACFQARVRFPGMKADSELEQEFWRPESPTGLARYVRAEKRDRIKAILNPEQEQQP
jgi:hypothetical protein